MKVNLNQQMAAPTLSSHRLYLRPAKLEDFEAIKYYRQDVENCRYIRPPESDQAVQNIVTQLSKPWKIEENYWNGLVVCLRNGTVIGEVVFRVEDWEQQRAEIGYRFNAMYGGKGFCTEATSLLLEHIINIIGFHKVVAKCDPRNIASYRVMEKLGFVREAFFQEHYLIGEEWTDQYDYGLLAKNWQKLN